MARLIWTDPALADLEEIADYIALDNPEAAIKLIRKVFTNVEHLKVHPRSGRKPPEFDSTVYREVIVKPCRVFYRIETDKIFILFVLREERELRRFLVDERNRDYN